MKLNNVQILNENVDKQSQNTHVEGNIFGRQLQESIRIPKKTTTKKKPNASSAFDPLGMRHVIIRTVFVSKTFYNKVSI